MSRLVVGLLLACLLVSGCGSGSDDTTTGQQATKAKQARERARVRAAHRRAVARREARDEARKAAARQAHREAVREEQAEQRQWEAEEAAREEEEEEEEEESECDPNYAGACLDPYASDYDCEGGSGDGPLYTGVVTVVGEDHYGLDADGDGVGCEL